MNRPLASSPPKVSVLMTVRNAAAFIGDAIASIGRQTWRDFELIVVDDGSSDGSGDIARRFAQEDERIRVLWQEPLGLVAGLNRASAEARGEFWARMDADDIARPRRLHRQVEFLSAHPDVGVLGTAVRRFGAARGRWQLPESDVTAKASLLFGTPFAHPTVMLRRSVWAACGGYRVDFRAAEDIDLWERMGKYTRFANLPEALLDYRVHATQVTAVDREAMAGSGERVRERVIRKLGLDPTAAELAVHAAIVWLRPGAADGLAAARAWLEKVNGAAVRSFPEAPQEARAVVARRWFEFCNCHSRLGCTAWRTYRAAGLSAFDPTSPWRRARFLGLCTLRQPRTGGRHA